MTDPYAQCVLALDYISDAIRVSDVSALHFAAFVWAQRCDAILGGEETWADQRMPPLVVGGGSVSAIHRIRPSAAVQTPLRPPSEGEPFSTTEEIEDPNKLREIALYHIKKMYGKDAAEMFDAED